VIKGREQGAQEECEDAEVSLKCMGYEVIKITIDPTKDKCFSEVGELRDYDSWDEYGSVVVALMAHGHDVGGLTFLRAADDMDVKLTKLFGMLSPDECFGLRGKPKFWIVQACRTGGDMAVQTDAAAPVPDDNLFTEHDNLITFVTSPGRAAYRGRFWKEVRAIMADKGAVEGPKVPWLEICGQANARMARGPDATPSVEMKSYLRDVSVSPAQLGGRPRAA
jgi:hypothetical protein